MDGPIRKAIIIQPTFEATGVNQSLWNLINIAWADFNAAGNRPQWRKTLVDRENFEKIEDNIRLFSELGDNFGRTRK